LHLAPTLKTSLKERRKKIKNQKVVKTIKKIKKGFSINLNEKQLIREDVSL
jgi:hypothetical protein